MAEELGEKTEDPTQRRLSDAREKGQVIKSQDLSGAIDLLGAVVLVVVFGNGLVTGLSGMLRAILSGEAPGSAAGVMGIRELSQWTTIETLKIVLPVLAIMTVVVIAAQLVQVQWAPTADPLSPKLERLDPLAGFGRVFSRKSVARTTAGVLKLVLISIVAGSYIVKSMGIVASLPRLELVAGFARLGDTLLRMCGWILLIMLVIGAADYVVQRWLFMREQRMTKQEVKEERKSMDGDPEMKGRRLKIARQLALQRMRQDVPKADVVVTNPTHYSVALKYDADKMVSPTVVAKGADYMAFRIREIAIANGVPIVEKPPLARALYASAPVGQQISPEHFEAVAEVLAYVYRINEQAVA